jgi:17beta-estradiol 17-dehydrogenase / very-long-chain 3-oxoacyl-CoA reductase
MVFSNSLRLEMKLKAKDIEVLGVMVGEVNSGANKKGAGFFVLSSRQMATAALDRVGCGSGVLFPAFRHAFLHWILQSLPHTVQDRVIVVICKDRFETEKKWAKLN